MPQRITTGTSNLCQHTRRLCAFVWLFIVVFLVPANVAAQTVTATGRVSGTVALSIPPNSIHNGVDVNAVSSGSTVRMTLSGTGGESPVIRVPLLVRSNIAFRISATFDSQTAELTHLSVVDVRPTGRLVSPEAINNLEILDQFNNQGPFVVASGPRVSLGGTLQSPNNALQITLLIRMKPQPTRDWLVQLTFFHH